MVKLFLPTSYSFKVRDNSTKREQIVLIPGAESMDRSQLEEIIAWQRENTAVELAQPKPKSKYSRKEVGQALNEYLKWLRAKQADAGFKKAY